MASVKIINSRKARETQDLQTLSKEVNVLISIMKSNT